MKNNNLKSSQSKLVIANWKLNPNTLREAKEIFLPIKRALTKYRQVDVVICPPAMYLIDLSSRLLPRLALGAQDLYWEEEGAHTGRLSPAMLKHGGASYVLVGHSEMRAAGDSNEIVGVKLAAAFKSGLRPILCVGERERDDRGEYLKFIQAQLEQALQRVPRGIRSQLVVAYEPIWAIGIKAIKADNPESFMSQAIFIRKILAGVIGQSAALVTPILYGGSVNQDNAREFMTTGQADGLLVGRASLRSDQFINIIETANGLSKISPKS